MKPHAEFNYHFSKKVFRDDNKLYFKILTSVFIIMFLFIIITASQDYSKYNLAFQQKIKKRYISLISKLITQESKISIAPIPGDINKDDILSPEEKKAYEKIKIAKSARGSYINSLQESYYSDMPDDEGVDINNDQQLVLELTHEGSASGSYFGRGLATRRKKQKMRHYDNVYDLVAHPFEYKLSRRGIMYINVTDELLQESETERVGYRDPDEIYRVVSGHLPTIEHCFQKARRINKNIKGYIKYEFRISYDGYVIPESIRILNSTIRDPLVEACIRKTIKRWRDFQKLDEKMGIARVVQKFAFN